MINLMHNDFYAVENALRKSREQRDSVKGKDTPYRVEFRYRGGTRHYQYFADFQSAKTAEDVSIRYGPYRPVFERPNSSQIQKRGPRGGWGKLR